MYLRNGQNLHSGPFLDKINYVIKLSVDVKQMSGNLNFPPTFPIRTQVTFNFQLLPPSSPIIMINTEQVELDKVGYINVFKLLISCRCRNITAELLELVIYWVKITKNIQFFPKCNLHLAGFLCLQMFVGIASVKMSQLR